MGGGAVLLDPDQCRHRRLRHLLDLTPAEFGQAIAIAKGTPQHPLTDPEDLFDAKIVDCTPRAREFGIEIGISGRAAVELMLKASK